MAFHPDWQAFEEELGFRCLLRGPTHQDLLNQHGHNVTAMLARYADVFAQMQHDATIATAEHRTSSGVALKSYTPPHQKAGSPLVCYIHGGGLALGSVAEDDLTCERLCRASGLVFVSVEYRLAPAHPSPAALDDCVDAVRWCAEHAAHMGATPGRVVIMGASAGAALALGTALRAIDESHRELVLGVVACQPMTLHPDAVPDEYKAKYASYEQNAESTINTAEGMRAFFDLYGASKTDPYIQNLLHPELHQLPRVYLNACERDTLRDDARLLRERLETLRVPISYDEYQGLPHFFHSFPSPRLKQVTDDYYSKTVKGIAFVAEG